MPSTELCDRIKTISQGEHCCLVYNSPAEQMAAVIPYLLEGLLRGECCLYVADERETHEIATALQHEGVEVEHMLRNGALHLLTKREAYLQSGTFQPTAMIDMLEQMTQNRVQTGFSGLRITGEMTWALGEQVDCQNVIRYEALLNRYFPGTRTLGLCQYNQSRFPPEIIRDVLRTHPVAILGDQVCSNLYYESPQMILGEEDATRRVDWMIEQLKQNRMIEQKLQQAMVETHHRVKNNLQIVAAMLDMLSMDYELQVPLEKLRQLKGHVEALATVHDVLTAQARQGTDATHVPAQHMLPKLVQLMQRLTPARPILLDVDSVELTARQGAALALIASETISNAMKHAEGTIRVRLQATPDTATLMVLDDGPGIPADFAPELHGHTGLELVERLARWDLAGTVAYQNRPEGGLCFLLTFPLTDNHGR